MISLAKIVRQILSEAMSFRQLWDLTNAEDGGARQARSQHVRVRDMAGKATKDGTGWTFSYGKLKPELDDEENPTGKQVRQRVTIGGDSAIAKKFKSEPAWNTTGESWAGYVRLLKDQKAYDPRNIEIQDLNCEVDCTCPDYMFRRAKPNANAGAGTVGAGAWNKNSGAEPKKYKTPGLCKHLMALTGYLGTNIKPVAPTPEDELTKLNKKTQIEKPQPTPPEKQQKTQPTKPTQPPSTPPEKPTSDKPASMQPKTSMTPPPVKKPTQPPQTPSPTSTSVKPIQKPQQPTSNKLQPTSNAPKPEDDAADVDDDSDNTYSDTRGLKETATQPITLAQTLDAFVGQNQTFNFPMYDDKE